MDNGVLKKNQLKKNSCEEKYAYNDVIQKYLHKIDDQRSKLTILHKEDTANYKAFKKEYTDEDNNLPIIDMSSEESIQNSEMTQVENKEVLKYDKSNKYSDWLAKTYGIMMMREKLKTKSEL